MPPVAPLIPMVPIAAIADNVANGDRCDAIKVGIKRIHVVTDTPLIDYCRTWQIVPQEQHSAKASVVEAPCGPIRR
jgi:hypothetical protein